MGGQPLTLDHGGPLRLMTTSKYGIKSIKFTGGDPGVYPDLLALLDAIAAWRRRFPSIAKWWMCTNGTPFLNREKFEALVLSALDNISIGIDSAKARLSHCFSLSHRHVPLDDPVAQRVVRSCG